MTRPLGLFPLWAIVVSTLSLVLCSILAGIAIARRHGSRSATEDQAPLGTVVGATLGLLAFILAFTFGMTAARFDARKQALLAEVNAIETAYLRAGLIPEPHRSEVRPLLREYVALRVGLAEHPESLADAIARSEQIQGELWSHATALGDAQLRNPAMASLFIVSLNEMFDLHTKRVTVGVYDRVPLGIWLALLGITILAMTQVGHLFGTRDRVNWPAVLTLSLAFSGVLVLIADLDRGGASRQAAIRIDQRPMIELQRRLAIP